MENCTVINYHNFLSVCIGGKIYNIHPEQQMDINLGDIVEVSITPFCLCEDDMDYEYMETSCAHFHPNAITECTNKVAVIVASSSTA